MSGLFGPSPYEIEQQRLAQANQNAVDYSRMNATQRGVMGLYQAGGMFGNMGAKAFGGADPAVQNAQASYEAMKSIDTSTPEGLMQYAAKIKEYDPNKATQAVMMARKMQAEAAKAAQEKSLADARIENYKREKPDPKEIMMLDIANDPEEPEEKRKMAAAWLAKNGSGSKGGTGRTQTLNTSIGMLNFDPYARTYKYADGSDVPAEMLRDMKPIGNDAVNAAAVAAAKAGGTAVGKSAGEAMTHLPKIDSDISTINDLGTKLFNHPGYKNLVGAGFPGLVYLRGSDVPGAKAFVDQIQGIGYLMAREELRGQGQVTEGEANAATAAFNRMNVATSERDFKDAYSDFVRRVENVREILRKKAGMAFDQGQYRSPKVQVDTRIQSNAQPEYNGYEGGSPSNAASEQIAVMQSELRNPNLNEQDKAAIRREIARLSRTGAASAPNTRKTKSGITYTVEP